MEGLIGIGLFFGGFAILDLLALRFGVDSRPESPDPRKPAHGSLAV
jgi:hypothetical protein